ncbi:MAG: hypothetical protein ACPL7B_08115 [Candidatus Poribacteria bacterium]
MPKNIILIMWAIIFLLISLNILAHQPVIVKKDNSKDKPVLVKKPEISFAFYGELAGEPHYYKIDSKKPINLYVNILVPDYSPKTNPILKHDMSFEILKGNTSIIIINGNSFEWKRFYEPYGKDNYYMGPEFDSNVDAGVYYVKVFNSNNIGKYSLAIGKKESFTPWGLVGALIKARSLDKWFFKP